MKASGVFSPEGTPINNTVLELEDDVPAATETRPAYYGVDNPYEPWKIIDHCKLGFYLGNVVKYVLRAGKKPNEPLLKDLKKAHEYLGHAIQLAEAGVERP